METTASGSGPEEVLVRDLDCQDGGLEQPDVPAPTVDLIAGLLAGFRLVGRPQ